MPNLDLPQVGDKNTTGWAGKILTAFGLLNTQSELALVGTYVIPAPANVTGDHTAHVLAHMTIAKTKRARSVVLPALDPSDPTKRWNLSSYLTTWSGLSLKLAAVKATNRTKPIVLIPADCDGATVTLTDAEGVRLNNYSEYTDSYQQFGINVRGSHAAVMVFGNRSMVRGYIHHFRTGVSAGNWTGVAQTNAGRPVGNEVDVTVDNVDFGIVYYAQKSGRFYARGNHIRTPGSPDEPHLIYATHSTLGSQDCTAAIDCWAPIDADGKYVYMEGVPMILKANSNLYVPYVKCRGTNGMLEIVNEYGPTRIDSMVGIDIGCEGVTSEGVRKVSGILWGGTSQPWTEPTSSKSVGSLSVTLRDDAVSNLGNFRVVTMNEGGWKIDSIDISYKCDAVSEAQALITVVGSNTDIGAVRIVNRGTGGMVALRYRNPSGGGGTRNHTLRTAPVINGCSIGVLVDPEVSDYTLSVDDGAIKASTRATDIPKGVGRNLRSVSVSANYRPGRMYGFPAAGAWTNTALEEGREFAQPILLPEPVTVTALALRVGTGVSGSSVRIGIRNDFGNGIPGSLVADSGSIDTAAAGDLNKVLTTPVYLPAGPYWLTVKAQGGSPTVRSASAGSVTTPASTLANALSGTIPYADPGAGALPTNFDEKGQAVSGLARIVLTLK